MGKKIAVIVYSDARREDFKTQALYETEAEVFDRSKIIKPHIEKLGYEVLLLPGNSNLIAEISKVNPDIVFNLVDSIYGKEDLCPAVPAMLEVARVPYTGASMEGQLLNTNKHRTKSALKDAGLPLPGYQLFSSPEEKVDPGLKFPLIVKLNKFHGSVEISQEAVVENEIELRNRVSYIIAKYGGQVLVEEYISGVEITVMIVDDVNSPLVLGEERIMKRSQKYKMFGFEEAWSDEELYDVKKYSLSQKIKNDIILAFRVLEMEDYARFELIVDKEGNHFFIDANSNPAFGPVEAGEAFGYILHMNNIPFSDVAAKIIGNAKRRFYSKN